MSYRFSDWVWRIVVVAFRGTQPASLANWITDLNTAKLSNYDGIFGAKVHEGFYNAYSNLRPQLQTALQALRAKYPNYEFLVTGHSLGGALADLAAVDSFSVFGSGGNRLDLVTFGEPRVGNGVSSQTGFSLCSVSA